MGLEVEICWYLGFKDKQKVNFAALKSLQIFPSRFSPRNGDSRAISVFHLPLHKADFHLVEFSDWTGNPLFVCENVAVILNRMSHVTNI